MAARLLGMVLVLTIVAVVVGATAVRSGWVVLRRGGSAAGPAAETQALAGVPRDSAGGEVAGAVAPPGALPPGSSSDSAVGAVSPVLPVPGATDSLALPTIAPDSGAATTGGAGSPTATSAEVTALRSVMSMPVRGVPAASLRDDFDQARGGGTRGHGALDIPAPRGTAVVAATDGRILKLFDSETGGLTIYQTEPTGRFVLLYGHLDRYAPALREGMTVRRGDVIGTVGTSGNADGGIPHLHFAVTRTADPTRWSGSGTPVNPYLLLRP